MPWPLTRFKSVTYWLMLLMMTGQLLLGYPQLAFASVAFKSNDTEIALGTNAQVLEDASGSITLNTILGSNLPWSSFDRDTFNFGFSKSSWWIKLHLSNQDQHEAWRVLDLGSALQDEIDVYVVRNGSTLSDHIETGDRRAFGNRPVETRAPSVPIHFGAGEQIDVYIKLDTYDGLYEAVALKLWSPNAYASATQANNMLLGMYFGLLFAVFAYHLFIFLSTKTRAFGLYALYIFAFFAWSFTFRGYAFQYLWPDSPNFNNQFLPIAANACFISLALFLMDYVGTRNNASVFMQRVGMVAVIGNTLLIIPSLLGVYALSFAANIPLAVAMMISGYVGAIKMMRDGSRPARYALIAFTLLGVGLILYYLRLTNLIASNFLTENFLQFGSACEVLLLAFGLADQLNQLKESKLKAEQMALAAKSALANELENLVERRTKALSSVNQRLSNLTHTDDLTGIYNQRHFDSSLASKVAHHSRCRAPFTLCLFDIDRLKRYNELYGQASGDSVLQRVTQTVQHHLRRTGDQIFRLENGEFALLLNLAADCNAQEFIEKIRADIETQHLQTNATLGSESTKCAAITASFGVLAITHAFNERLTLPATLDKANQLLTEAKQDGRNRVKFELW